MKHPIDKATWSRREYYEFFGRFDDPYFGVVANVDFTECYREAKASGCSFSLCALHRILHAVNAIDEFHYRAEQDEIVRYDTIHVSSTIGRSDGSFGFGFMEYVPDREEFLRLAMQETARVARQSGLCLTEEWMRRNDIIRFSAVPWIAFTEMKHATNFRDHTGAPRISTGRLIHTDDDQLVMPVSLDAHHGFMDGRHAGLFYEIFDERQL